MPGTPTLAWVFLPTRGAKEGARKARAGGRLLQPDLVPARAGWASPASGAQGRQHAPEPLPAGFRLARETVDVEQRLEKETRPPGPALSLPARRKDAGSWVHRPEGAFRQGPQLRSDFRKTSHFSVQVFSLQYLISQP